MNLDLSGAQPGDLLYLGLVAADPRIILDTVAVRSVDDKWIVTDDNQKVSKSMGIFFADNGVISATSSRHRMFCRNGTYCVVGHVPGPIPGVGGPDGR